MTDAANNVRVCLRIRPLLGNELTQGETTNAAVLPDGQTVRVMTNQSTFNRQLEAHQYRLDSCCGPEMSQREFFHHSGVESFCDNAMEGQAATVFCFGQTGSGKTFTMSGPHMADPLEGQNNSVATVGVDETQSDTDTMGLQYRGVHYIANAVRATNKALIAEQLEKGGVTEAQLAGFVPITMRASYVEIYQEQVNDLLNGTENLKIRWSQGAQSFFIENLMIVTCDDVTDLLAVLGEGGANRKRAAHKLNVDSSRSHVLFTIYFERRESASSPPKYGKINFVDLAGSERLKDSESVGVNADETRSINKSLFTLGKVISALSRQSSLKHKQNNQSGTALDGALDEVFVPYRDSALTKLLMDSLGGSCRTLMVACITPAQRFTDESIRTIIYAMRTRNIVNSMPRVRMDPTQRQVYELKMELEYFKKENAALKARLAAYEGDGGGSYANSLLLMGGSQNPKQNTVSVISSPQQPQKVSVAHAPATIQHNYMAEDSATTFDSQNTPREGSKLIPQQAATKQQLAPKVPPAASPTTKANSAPPPQAGNGTSANYDGLKGPTLQHLIPRQQQQAGTTPTLPPLPTKKANDNKANPITVKTNTYVSTSSNTHEGTSPTNGGLTPKTTNKAIAGGLPPVHSSSGSGGVTPKAPSSQPPSSHGPAVPSPAPARVAEKSPVRSSAGGGGSRAANASLRGGRSTPTQQHQASSSAPTTANPTSPPPRVGTNRTPSLVNEDEADREDDEHSESRDPNAVFTDGSTQVPSIHGNSSNSNTPHRIISDRNGGQTPADEDEDSDNQVHTKSSSPPPPPPPAQAHTTNPRTSSAVSNATTDNEGPTNNSSNKPITSPDGAVLAAAWASQPTMTVAGLKDFGFKPAAKRSQRL